MDAVFFQFAAISLTVHRTRLEDPSSAAWRPSGVENKEGASTRKKKCDSAEDDSRECEGPALEGGAVLSLPESHASEHNGEDSWNNPDKQREVQWNGNYAKDKCPNRQTGSSLRAGVVGECVGSFRHIGDLTAA